MATETAWLCERTTKDIPLEYLSVHPLGFFEWTTDHMKALRLARRQDADAVASIVEEVDRVVEHAWHDAPSQSETTFEVTGGGGWANGQAPYVCDLPYLPESNALANCKACGWPIAKHNMVDQFAKGPFAPKTGAKP